MRLASLIIASLLLSGCWTTPEPPKPTPPAGATAAAVSTLASAEATTKANVAANVETARKANETQPETPAKQTVESELALAATRLDTTPSPAELLAGEQRARAIAEGRTDEARNLYTQATTQATEEAKARAKAEAGLQAALLQQAQAAERYQADLASLQAKHAAQLEAARNEVMKDQVKWLNRVAAACAALAVGTVGLCIAFGGLAALRIAGPFAALCGFAALACFGLAQIVGAWWFKWAALGGCAIFAAGAAAWIWKHYRQGDLKAQAESKAASYGTALKQIVPVLDDAYEHAEASTKEALDKLIFSRLSSAMNAEDKATIHTIRADK
jgi:chemotaxis protein histidine kinase CheA